MHGHIFGRVLTISGHRVAVSAFLDDVGAEHSGSAYYVFPQTIELALSVVYTGIYAKMDDVEDVEDVEDGVG